MMISAFLGCLLSLPSRERGLKFYECYCIYYALFRRSPRGSED